MKRLLFVLGFTILSSACSNPFSSRKPSVLVENPNPTNTNCSDVRFDQAELTAKQFRSVIHCLNQNQELKELETWSLEVTDEEFKPLLLQFNSMIQSEPEFLYALKEFYVEVKNEGSFQKQVSSLFSKINDQDQKKRLVRMLKSHSRWLTDFISEPKYKINVRNLVLLSEVKSFRRGVDEQLTGNNLAVLLGAIGKYRSKSDSFTFQQLFRFFSQTSPELVSNRESAEKIANFMNWLLDQDRLEVFSKATETLTSKPIECFGGGKVVEDSLKTLLVEMREINPDDISSFVQKKLSSLLLLGQGYCQIPPQVITAAKLLQESVQQDSVSSFFHFIQPLLLDPDFVKLLGSAAFRELGNDIKSINNTHAFQDFITLVNWLKKNPVLESNVDVFMDSIFNEFSSNEINLIMNWIPEDVSLFRTLEKLYLSLPSLKNSKGVLKNKNWILPFTHDSFGPVLGLISKMNDEDKIIPIVDRLIVLFQKMLDLGRSGYQKYVYTKSGHSPFTNSQNWLLKFLKNNPVIYSSGADCSNIPVEVNFFRINNSSSIAEYFNKLEITSRCYGMNQSFLSIKDLAEYLLKKDSTLVFFTKASSVQDELMNYVFSLNSTLAFEHFVDLVHLKKSDLLQVKTMLLEGSAILSATKETLKSSTEIRKTLAKYLSKKETYAALLAQKDAPDQLMASAVVSEKDLFDITLSGLPHLIEKYCPTLNPSHTSCELEDDQVKLYLKNPRLLAEKIVAEYMGSSQSWIHPSEFSEWKTGSKNPDTVSDFEFHLNPLLYQFNNDSKSVTSIFNFIDRNEKSEWKLSSFAAEKSKNISLIPYIFQSADYPDSEHEFHAMIRLRLVSDLDRLELLAINADFKPFGFIRNFGMDFIQEIATSWGDVPAEDRPAAGTAETLAEARTSILNQFSKFNLGILQKVGACDARGKNRFGRWIQSQLCSGELSDIRARMFNLNFMLSILDDHREMVILRDLFYSLYEQNSEDRIGEYPNGIKNAKAVRQDLLGVIPKIARLGLIHQISLSMNKGDPIATESIVRILAQSNREGRTQEFATFLSGDLGQQMIRDVLSLSMNMEKSEKTAMSVLLQNLSHLDNEQWINFILSLYQKNPDVLKNFLPTIHMALQNIKIKPLVSPISKIASSISNDLKNQRLVSEISVLIKKSNSTQDSIRKLLTVRLEKEVSLEWLKLLAMSEKQKQRDQLAAFVTGKWFDNFCDVYSDTRFAEKTYIFLDKSNQNSGVIGLLDECRHFLH